MSCTHFQCAAWAFQQLRDNFDSNSSPDMNHTLLTFQSNIMLVCDFMLWLCMFSLVIFVSKLIVHIVVVCHFKFCDLIGYVSTA